MFGRRSDGRRIKNLDPIFKIMPTVMKERNDSQVLFKQDINLQPLEDYINKKAEEGIRLSYMNIIYAAIVRIIGQRPKLNRFIMSGDVYARDSICVSLMIKKDMSDEAPETVTKIEYTGNETIFEIRDKLEKVISENKEMSASNDTDKLVGLLSKIPSGIVKFAVNMLMWMDKRGIMPKAVIKASPFHTSVFLTNVGSLGIDSIYHHIYNFGTTSLFFAMGKKKKSYVYEDDEIRQEKCITIAFVGDERICDGYYYASSFKQLQKILKHPEVLEEPIEAKRDIL